MTSGDWEDGIHVRDLSEQVNGDDGARARRDGLFQEVGVHRVARGVDIDEHRSRPGVGDRLGGGHERAGDGDDLVPRADPQRQQAEPEGIGAVADADGVRRAAEGGELLLELRDKGAAGERSRVHDFGDRAQELLAQRRVMGAKVQEGDLHVHRLQVFRTRAL